MTEHNRDTRTLNTLIATLLDSVDGYQKSANDIENPALAEKFSTRARERQAFRDEAVVLSRLHAPKENALEIRVSIKQKGFFRAEGEAEFLEEKPQ